MKFQRSVTKAIGSSPGGGLNMSLLEASNKSKVKQTKATVGEFLSGLETYLKLPARLKWSLLYTETAPDCDVAARGNQDSLIRNLLNIDELQTKLIAMLTDTLLTLAYEQ